MPQEVDCLLPAGCGPANASWTASNSVASGFNPSNLGIRSSANEMPTFRTWEALGMIWQILFSFCQDVTAASGLARTSLHPAQSPKDCY